MSLFFFGNISLKCPSETLVLAKLTESFFLRVSKVSRFKNHLVIKVFLEQPLALPGFAKYSLV